MSVQLYEKNKRYEFDPTKVHSLYINMMHSQGNIMLVGGAKTFPLIKVGIIHYWTGDRAFHQARLHLHGSYDYPHWHKVMLNYLEAVWTDYEKAFQT